MSKNFVSSSFLNTLLVYLESNGYDDIELISKIEQFKERYQWQMPREDFLHLLNAIKTRYNRPALGFRIGRGLKSEHFGMVGYMGISCSSLGQALRRYHHHQLLVDSTLNTSFETTDTQITIRWWQNDPTAHGIWGEFGVMVFINFYQALIGRDIPPECVELPCKPDGDPKIYEILSGCPVKFEADAVGITLPRSLYSMKISTSDPYLRSLYDRQATALLHDFSEKSDFLSLVKQAIKEGLQDEQDKAEDIAKKLGLSLRTFYRRLDEQGFRYRALLADTRFALAKTYLQDKTLSLSQISLMLGYAEQSAFTRAFISWGGLSPSKYRNRYYGVK
ncbi:AraC family transcriptional regulator ligand-binding domain-containing protein [Acinetobacter sp. WZC-1]|uniref:AraC family transcriptional regulator ligand-binding domain-containing protein n=1 Tax=Acinetobacter sp. WZC-1 TaxID=3459034 RepID=UPI00403DDD6A